MQQSGKMGRRHLEAEENESHRHGKRGGVLCVSCNCPSSSCHYFHSSFKVTLFSLLPSNNHSSHVMTGNSVQKKTLNTVVMLGNIILN